MALPEGDREATEARPLRGWEAFRELEDLHSEMGQLMNSALAPLGAINGVWAPVADIEETEDAWVVEAELPGVGGKDVKVELRDSELWVSGEIKTRERKGVLRRGTRRTGRFAFRVSLPGEFDAGNIEAKLDSDVLTVRIPKSGQPRPRRIEVDAPQA